MLSIEIEYKEQDEKVQNQATEITPEKRKKILDYQTKTNEIVDLLKADLTDTTKPSRRILDRVVEDGKKFSIRQSFRRFLLV